MAKKRKAKKRTTRRRRIGALNLNPGNPIIKIAAVGVGYLAADQINAQVTKISGGKLDPKIQGGVMAAGGLLLLMGKGKASMLKTLAGGVLAGAGGKGVLQSFGVINGYSNVPVISGYSNVPVIAGYNPPPGAMNGFTVPQPMHTSIMGGIGSLGEDGSGINNADR